MGVSPPSPSFCFDKSGCFSEYDLGATETIPDRALYSYHWNPRLPLLESQSAEQMKLFMRSDQGICVMIGEILLSLRSALKAGMSLSINA